MKSLFYMINAIMIVAIAYFCVEIFYKNIIYFPSFESSFSKTAKKEIKKIEAKPGQEKSQYDVIIKRNLFKVEVEQSKEQPLNREFDEKSIESLEATNLKLVLWGTVTGIPEAYAVIGDVKSKHQSLYGIGDMVQGASLKKILRYKVILHYKGKDQVLEIKTDDKTDRLATSSSAPTTQEESIAVERTVVKDSADNTRELTKQIKIRPHFTRGEADGLMVYGIRANSVFMQLGLKNGDIVKEINGVAIVSAEDASSFYEQINGAEEESRITLLRRGKKKELLYKIENGDRISQEEDNKGDK